MVGCENWGEMETGEYSDKTDRSWHACSASELPTVKDLRCQIDFFRFCRICLWSTGLLSAGKGDRASA